MDKNLDIQRVQDMFLEKVQQISNKITALEASYLYEDKKNPKKEILFIGSTVKEYSEKLINFFHAYNSLMYLPKDAQLSQVLTSQGFDGGLELNITDTEVDISFNPMLPQAYFEDWCSALDTQKLGKQTFFLLRTIKYEPLMRVGVFLTLNEVVENEGIREIFLILKEYALEIALTRLANIYIQQEAKAESLERFNNEVNHFGHTIHNIFPEGLAKIRDIQTIEQFGHTIHNILPEGVAKIREMQTTIGEGDMENAIKELVFVEKKLAISLIIFQIISNQQPTDLEEKSLIGLLSFLVEKETTKHKILFTIEGKAKLLDFTPKHEITREGQIIKERNSIFIILWNLLYNAVKYSGIGTESDIRDVLVSVKKQGNRLAICFENVGEKKISIQTKRFLRGEADLPDNKLYLKSGESGGLVITKRRIDLLRWKILIPDEDEELEEIVDVYGMKSVQKLYKTSITVITNDLSI